MIPFRKSIGFRLLGISFILLAIPLLVDSFVLVTKRYEHTIADAKNYLLEAANLRELPLTQIQLINRSFPDVISHLLHLQSDFPKEPDKVLNEKLAKMARISNFSEIFLLKVSKNQQYIVTASNIDSLVGKNYTDFFKLKDPLFPDSLKKDFHSYFSYNSQTLQSYFTVLHPIFSTKENKIIGLLAISNEITGKLKDLLREDKHCYPVKFALLLPSTVVFASTDPSLRFQYFRPLQPEYRHFLAEQKELIDKKPLKVDETIRYPFFEFKWEGEEQIGYIKKLPMVDVTLLTYASKKAIFRSPMKDFSNTYSTYGLILIVGGIVAYLLTMRMARPIQNLSQVMQKGDLTIRYQKDILGFEINALGAGFNEMVDALMQQRKVAEKERVEREILTRELKLGQQVQRTLFPQKMPKYQGVDLAEKYIPAIEVGGDFYDVFIKKRKDLPEQLVLAVADGSGKGVQACFYSLSVRNMLRTYAKQYEDVGVAMSATNNLFQLDTAETGMFVTVLMGVYDSETKLFHYFSAGHNPPILRRGDGKIEVLKEHGIAMGVIPTKDQHAKAVQLYEGDTLVLYTDGVTEAHDVKNQLYGEERLIDLIAKQGWKGSSQLVNQIVEDVNNFAGKTPQHDDITLLIMKIKRSL